MYKAPYVLPWLDSSDADPEAGVPFEAGRNGEGNCFELVLRHWSAVVLSTKLPSGSWLAGSHLLRQTP